MIINIENAWQHFLQSCIKAREEQDVFDSPKRGHRYHIMNVNDKGVQLWSEEATTERRPTLRYQLFSNALKRVLESGGRLPKTQMCGGNVLFETVMVRFLPMLRWEREHKNILLIDTLPIIQTDEITAGNVRETAKRDVIIRRGQERLRKELLQVYNSRCCITGCQVIQVLDAAHIIPYHLTFDSRSVNALLLRADIHDLYDAFLLGVHPESFIVRVAKEIEAEYSILDGKILAKRNDGNVPDREGMQLRWNAFNKRG